MIAKTKHITIEVEVPRGIPIGDLSREYSAVTFNVTNGNWIATDERLIYITSNELKQEHFNFLEKHMSIIDIEKIGSVIIAHIKSRLFNKFEHKKLAILYPTRLKNGKHKIEFLINGDQLSSLKQALPNCKIIQIKDSYNPKFELTKRQEEIITKAQSLGYFKYPRDLTLTELAKVLKISKATLSQSLRSIETKAIQNLVGQNKKH